MFQPSQSSAFPISVGPLACAQPAVTSSVWVEGALVPAEELQGTHRLLAHHPRRDPAPGPVLQQCLLLPPLPSPVSNCLNMPFGTRGRSRKLKAFFLQIRNGTHGNTSVSRRAPQGPAQLQSFYLHNPLVGDKKVGLFRTWKVVPSQTFHHALLPLTAFRFPKLWDSLPSQERTPASTLCNSS